jgi:hypothetical protein
VRSARHQTKNLHAAIAQPGGDAQRRHDLVNRARELNQKQGAAPVAAQIAELQKQANDLKSRIPVAERDSAREREARRVSTGSFRDSCILSWRSACVSR